MWSWEGGSKILESEADLSDLLLDSPINLLKISTPNKHHQEDSLFYFSILHPPWFVKKNLGFKLPRNISCGSAGDSDLSTHQNGGAPFFQPTPKHHPNFKVTPTAGVAANPNVHTPGLHWVLGYCGTPQKEEERSDPKKKAGKMFMYGTPEDHWVFASEMQFIISVCRVSNL